MIPRPPRSSLFPYSTLTDLSLSLYFNLISKYSFKSSSKIFILFFKVSTLSLLLKFIFHFLLTSILSILFNTLQLLSLAITVFVQLNIIIKNINIIIEYTLKTLENLIYIFLLPLYLKFLLHIS